MDDDFFWPEWVEELYDKDYSEEHILQLSQSEEDDWEFLLDD